MDRTDEFLKEYLYINKICYLNVLLFNCPKHYFNPAA